MPLTPIAAPIITIRQWRHVSIIQIFSGSVIIKGYSTRGGPARSIQYPIGDTTHLFVELDKNASWFLKGAGGMKMKRGGLKPVKVLDMLRAFLNAKLKQNLAEQLSAVAGSQSDSQEPDEDIDPMDAMDVMDELVEAVPQATKKPRNTQRIDRAVVEELVVPTRPVCGGCNKDDKAVVCVYRKPLSEKRSNGNLFLRVDCMHWLLTYAADELHFHGVEPASPDPIHQQQGNCPAVADLHLAWDDSAKAWEAKLIPGALVGTTKRICVNDLNNDMWATLRAESRVEGYLCQASPLQKRNAVKKFITLWFAAIAGNKAAEFEALSRSRGMELEATEGSPSSTRGKKRALEDTAVASEEVCFADAVTDTAVAAEEVCLAAAVTDTAVAA